AEDTTQAARGLYVSAGEGPPPGFERRAQPLGEAAPLGRAEEGAKGEALPVGGEKQPVLPFRALFEDDAQPERLEAPAPLLAANPDPLDIERALGEAHGFALPRAAIAQPESEVEQRHVEAEEAGDRPGAGKDEADAAAEADRGEHRHDPEEAARRQAAKRRELRSEEDRLWAGLGHIRQAYWSSAAAVKRGAWRPASAAARIERMTRDKAAKFFTLLAKDRPDPATELQYLNPYTLLVAVVLSAQATDVSVNKATEPLFAIADTPQKMLDLGEARLKGFIKTIGLFNTKAKNVIALSRLLIEQHGGQVPRMREALEALPGVGRKTANVVLNVAFGEPTIAVDTHIFRVANRTGIAPGRTPLEVEAGLEKVTPAEYKLGAHHWLILHGRYVCKARKPDCLVCVVADLCRYGAKTAPSELIAARAEAVTPPPLTEPRPGRPSASRRPVRRARRP